MSYIWCFLLLSVSLFNQFSCRVDLCHQSDDEDEEDEESNIEESLLEKTFNERSSLNTDNQRRCLPFRLVHVRSRQRIVILVLEYTIIHGLFSVKN